MDEAARILVVAGKREQDLLLATLQRCGLPVSVCDTTEAATHSLTQDQFAAAVVDLSVARHEGLSQICDSVSHRLPVTRIVVYGEGPTGDRLTDGDRKVVFAVANEPQQAVTSVEQAIIAFLSDELKQSRQQLRLQQNLLAGVPHAVMGIDLSGRVTLWNACAEVLYGWSAAEAVHARLADLLCPVDDGVAIELENPATSIVLSCSREIVVRHRSGATFPVQLTITPLRNDHGAAAGCLCVSTDISSRTKERSELRTVRRLLNDAQRVAGVGSWEWSIEDDKVWWSAQLYQMYGIDPYDAALTRKDFLQHVMPEDRDYVADRISAAINDNDSYHVTFRTRNADGAIRFHVAQGEVERDAAGRPIRMYGTDLDITDQRKKDQQLRRAERLASLGTLAAGIAHEINNPLSAAWIAAENASMFRDEAEVLDESLHTISRAIQRCQVIISNVLRFAREESSAKRPGDLNAVTRTALKTTRHYIQLHGCQIETNFDKDLPPVVINASEIEQVLVNLLRNAVQSGQHTRISVSTCHNDQAVFCVIRDNGRGIPEADLQHVFDPFFTRRTEGEGTGLGLAFSHGIIEAHGGQITIESTVEVGTSVTITLPAVPPVRVSPRCT